jgi:DNA-binding FadR family transcriptional regulator
MEHVEKQVAWFLSILMSNRGDESWPEHRSLLEAIQAGDSKNAAKIMSEHTLATYEAYMSSAEAGLVEDEVNVLEESAE